METQEPRRGGLILSILGRLSLAVLFTLLGLIIGGFVGVYLGFQATNASPSAPATMGFETAGVASVIVFVMNVAIGAAGGAIVGLLIGVVSAIFVRRRRA
jgi:hypothetical protein